MAEDYKPREKAGFNDALGYLGRLNQLWYKTDNARLNLDFYSWFNLLLTIYTELIPRIHAEERLYFEALYPKLLNLMISQPFIMVEDNLFMNPELYRGLHDFETQLRDISHQSHLDMPEVRENDDLESF